MQSAQDIPEVVVGHPILLKVAGQHAGFLMEFGDVKFLRTSSSQREKLAWTSRWQHCFENSDVTISHIKVSLPKRASRNDADVQSGPNESSVSAFERILAPNLLLHFKLGYECHASLRRSISRIACSRIQRGMGIQHPSRRSEPALSHHTTIR